METLEQTLHRYYIGQMDRNGKRYFFYDNIPPRVIKDWELSHENYPQMKIWRDKGKRNYHIRKEV